MPIIPNIMKLIKVEGCEGMIVYTPLWETMKQRGITTYTLREKYRVSGATVQRLKKNQSVSTNTLADLCDILQCELGDVAAVQREPKNRTSAPTARRSDPSPCR